MKVDTKILSELKRDLLRKKETVLTIKEADEIQEQINKVDEQISNTIKNAIEKDSVERLDTVFKMDSIILHSVMDVGKTILNKLESDIKKLKISEEKKMLSIKASVLREFVSKATANGTIKDCKLDFQEKGLNMQHKDDAGVVCIIGFLDKTNFTTYEVCKVNVKDSKTFLKALSSFKDTQININVEKNNIQLLDENGKFDLVQSEKLDCYLETVPGLTYDNSILVASSIISDILSKSAIVPSEDVFVENDGKNLYFRIGKETDKAEVKTGSNFKGNIKTVFDLKYLEKLSSVFGLVVEFSISDKLPSKFIEKNDKFALTYFLTPISEIE